MLRGSLTLLLGLSATSVLSVDLFQALQSNGFTDFARLAAQVPSITQVPGSGQVIYASTNQAIREANLNRGPGGSRRRQDGGDGEERPTPEELECQCTNTHSQKQKRDAIVSPGSARQTLLDDPGLVNLGPGRNQTVVEKCLPNLLYPIIYSGLAVNVSVVGNDIPFDGGVIRPVGGVFTVPATLSRTLGVTSLNTNTFFSALNRTGLLSQLDGQTSITILAPTDAALVGTGSLSDADLARTLQRHVLVNVTAYTPLIRNGDTYVSLAGDTVTVAFQNGGYYVNGAKIVREDVIIKNGVLHTIDKVLGASSAGGGSSGGSGTPTQGGATSTSTVVTGAGYVLKPTAWSILIWTFAAVVMVQVCGWI